MSAFPLPFPTVRPRIETARPTTWRLGDRPSLDSLRGIAILLVLGAHFHVPLMSSGGVMGVTLFFVLSGYLITALLIEEWGQHARIDLRGFYIRRARRLLPALAVLMGVLAIWAIATGQLGAWLPGAASVALYVGNWADLANVPMPGLAHTWSLAVEEQFYLIWPLCLMVLLRGGLRRTALAVLVVIVLSFAVTGMTSGLASLYGTPECSKSLLLGAIVAMASAWLGRDVRLPSSAAALAAVLLAVLVTGACGDLTPVLAPIPPAVLVAWAAAEPRGLAFRWLRFTGRISYGLYLYHYPLTFGPFALFDGLALWPRAALLLGASYLLAIVSWRLVESRFVKRRARSANAVPRLSMVVASSS